MFEGTREDKDLKPEDKGVFKNYEGASMMMRDCLVKDNEIHLSDVGSLVFSYSFSS